MYYIFYSDEFFDKLKADGIIEKMIYEEWSLFKKKPAFYSTCEIIIDNEKSKNKRGIIKENVNDSDKNIAINNIELCNNRNEVDELKEIRKNLLNDVCDDENMCIKKYIKKR